MAHCDQGYICEVCGEDVENMIDSDLYLRYILGEVESGQLMAIPERHLRCNPVIAQFIVAPEFLPVFVEGPFDKRQLDANDVARREERTTRGWRRLQEVRGLGVAINEYPLSNEEKRKNAPR
jgi:hypothetical protein